MNELRPIDFLDLEPMESTFRNLMRPWRMESLARAPQIKVEVSEGDDSYTVKADIPGVRKEDIDVRVEGSRLTISAELKKESEEKNGGRVLRSERQYGYASRSFELDSAVDDGKTVAKYQDGVLTMTLPKKAVATQHRVSID